MVCVHISYVEDSDELSGIIPTMETSFQDRLSMDSTRSSLGLVPEHLLHGLSYFIYSI